VTENVTYHTELCALADHSGLKHATAKTVPSALAVPSDIPILFLLSVPNSLKTSLLSSARLLVYTPRNEHFGIVPLEAMLACTPVLAANEGGPRETVIDGETGWLRDVSQVEAWTEVMRTALNGKHGELRAMGSKGKQRVEKEFSKEKMATRLDEEIRAMLHAANRPPLAPAGFWYFLVAGFFAAFAAYGLRFLLSE